MNDRGTRDRNGGRKDYETLLITERVWYLTTGCNDDLIYLSYTPDTMAYSEGQTPYNCVEKMHAR